MKFNHQQIISTTDLSEYSNATIDYGVFLAKNLGLRLKVCHVLEQPPVAPLYGGIAINSTESQARMEENALTEIRRIMKGADVEWEPFVSTGDTANEIASMATEDRADIIIVAAHVQSGLQKFILGSVTERLMRTSPCPLLVLRGPVSSTNDERPREIKIRRILAGCDFSELSNLAFEHALTLAQEFQAELHMVHVVNPAEYKRSSGNKSGPEFRMDDELIEKYEQKLQDMIPPEAKNWCHPEIKIIMGKPHEELNKYSLLNDMDLIVLGTRGVGLLESVLVGSTTDRLIRQSPCPILSVCNPKDS